MYPAQQQQQGIDTGTTDDSRSKFSVCTGTTSAPSRPRVRTCGVVYWRLEMRTRPRRVQMPIPPDIGTSVLLPLLRLPLLSWLLLPTLELALLTTTPDSNNGSQVFYTA